MDFRARLEATFHAVQPLFEVPGVLVIGSEVPNLLQPGAASTLVVSKDVDVGIPVESHRVVRDRLGDIRGLRRSVEEPSVWVPERPDLLEVNFFGIDHSILDPSDTYVLDDPGLPLLVFGPLSLLSPGAPVPVGNVLVPVPRLAGLFVEKLATDRSAEKGARDLLVAAGLFFLATSADEMEIEELYCSLPDEMRHTARSNLTILSLLEPLPGMPDPRPLRARFSLLLTRLDAVEKDRR